MTLPARRRSPSSRSRRHAVRPRRHSTMSGLGGMTTTLPVRRHRPARRRRHPRRRPRAPTGCRCRTGSGEWIWRPLQQPGDPADLVLPRREPEGLRPDAARPRLRGLPGRRPALRAAPERSGSSRSANGGQGAVQLIEIPSDSEVNDNILAYWRPRDGDRGRHRGAASPIASAGAGTPPERPRLATVTAHAQRPRQRRGGGACSSSISAATTGRAAEPDLRTVLTATPRHDPRPPALALSRAQAPCASPSSSIPAGENAVRVAARPASAADRPVTRDMAVPLDALTAPDPAAAARGPPSRPADAAAGDARWRCRSQSLATLESPTERRTVAAGASGARPGSARALRLRRRRALLTAYGAWRDVRGRVGQPARPSLQYVLLVLFTLNFSWIALAFTSAVARLPRLLLRRAPTSPRRAR